MKNVIYKYYISQICWAIHIILILFEELFKITYLAGYCFNLSEITNKGGRVLLKNLKKL